DDGQDDFIEPGGIMLTGNVGSNSTWVITDEDLIILGLPSDPTMVNFEGAGSGTCLVWHLSWDGDLMGAEEGLSASDLQGCFSLSNSVQVLRLEGDDCAGVVNGGILEGGPFEFCVGDGVDDFIPEGGISLIGNLGENNQWVVTDATLNILGLPMTPGEVNFDVAGGGECLIWNLSFNGTLTGVEVGMNAADIQGDFDLSNSISVIRNQPMGGMLEGGPFEFCVGDETPDFIQEGEITLMGDVGENGSWVITDSDLNILGLPASPSEVDFDGAGSGTCLIWYLSWYGDVSGAEEGANAGDLQGCFNLSNSIEVIRNQPEGGVIDGGPFEFCVGDGNPDMIEQGVITLEGNSGSNSAWVITDGELNILALPGDPSEVDFEGAEVGVCLIWHLSWDGDIIGAEVGANAADLQGCFSLSNFISVNRIDCSMMGAVAISEINFNGDIEIINTGSTSVDISTMFLCQFPTYLLMSELTIVCGDDLILDPGEAVVVGSGLNLSRADGELAIYSGSNFTNSDFIVDYVEWGSSGHQRSNVAANAGIWGVGDFIPAVSGNNSLLYDGSGDTSGDWSEGTSSPCSSNVIGNGGTASLQAFPNPASNFVILDIEDRNNNRTYQISVFDIYGNLVISRNLQAQDERKLIVDDLNSGRYIIQLVSKNYFQSTSVMILK
ncbi:MAG: T9SS type A sorting domain-containing protein, partial [Saprospiraceae bacterium]|nr:T9SS type A sorting domain-containing protein [Saprospiraceae bacterium]